MRCLLVIVLLAAACTSGGTSNATGGPPTAPIAGTFRGASFTISSGSGVIRNGQLALSFANQSFPCGDPFPRAGWIIADISIPVALEKPGTYALGPSYIDQTVPGAAVTKYTGDDAGKITSQDSILFDHGTLWITSVTATHIDGAVSTETLYGSSVSGTFSVPICAPDGGAP